LAKKKEKTAKSKVPIQKSSKSSSQSSKKSAMKTIKKLPKIKLTAENRCGTCEKEVASYDVKLLFAFQGTLTQGKKTVLVDQEVSSTYDIAGMSLPFEIERGEFSPSMCDKCVNQVEDCTQFSCYQKPKAKATSEDDLPAPKSSKDRDEACQGCGKRGVIYYEGNMFLQFYQKDTGFLTKQRDCDDSHDRSWKCWKCFGNIDVYNGQITISSEE
jgi:hypothetical protein